MTAFLRIDQDGLSTGTAGRSRTDGKADGSLVTLTDTSPGAGSTAFTLLWTPPGDVDAAPTLEATGDPKVWTFTPTEGKYGTYLVELAKAGELPERRAIVVRTPNLHIVIPALSEHGYPNASLANADGAELVDNNATDYDDADLNVRPFASWWRAMHELIMRVDAGAITAPGVAGQPAIWNGEAWIPLLAGEPLSLERIIGTSGALALDAATVVGAVDGAVGFYGTEAIARPSVSGAEADALLSSLITALAELGLITDDR